MNKITQLKYLLIFFTVFFIINFNSVKTGIYYRIVASDYNTAFLNSFSFLIQSLITIFVLFICSKRIVFLIILSITFSTFLNFSFFSVMNVNLDSASFLWILEEYRQAQSAFGQFFYIFASCLFKSILLSAVLYYVLTKIRPEKNIHTTTRSTLFFLVYLFSSTIPYISNFNSYTNNIIKFSYIISNTTHPDRNKLDIQPTKESTKKIIIIVDESVSDYFFKKSDAFKNLDKNFYADYGPSFSFSNCSAQSNAALRWGVNVGEIRNDTDLRTSPSIWSYAKNSGYRTIMIDGQVKGNPQNLLWKPEMKLIDEFMALSSGLDTDLKISNILSEILSSESKDFVYVVLRGAHYQYETNYPKDYYHLNETLSEKYLNAINYSKLNFFDNLTRSITGKDAVIFYTSDHGQSLSEIRPPHCNDKPVADEFIVPLLMIFDKNKISHKTHDSQVKKIHSHSQIFSSSLLMMGYNESYVRNNFDNPLPEQTKSIILFGKKIFPVGNDKVEFLKIDPEKTANIELIL